MTKRTKQNFKLIVTLAVLTILVVLALKTLWVGFNLMMYSNDVVESGKYANEIYQSVKIERERFYYSNDMYIRWLSNLSNFIRIPLGVIVIFYPYIFISYIRNYNMNKKKRKNW